MNIDSVTLIRCDTSVLDVFGKQWLDRAIEKKQEQDANAHKQLRNLKHQYIYQKPMHPVVRWHMAFRECLGNIVKTRRFEPSETILKYILLGKMLEVTRNHPGFENIIHRLKLTQEFFSAMFEVEVAYFYITNNCQVEFIDVGDNKSPDLKVTSETGETFWVECKCRDERTERDKNVSGAWEELESRLLKTMGPRKLNYGVFVKAREDPQRKEMNELFRFVMELVQCSSGLDGSDRDGEFVQDPSGRYDILVKELASADEWIDSSVVAIESLEETDRALVHFEQQINQDGKSIIKNPLVFWLRTAIPPDKVSGIIHGLKSAVAQLPDEGPGVVWVRMPDDYWSTAFEKWFNRAKDLLQKELNGSHNRRVNRVNVMTRVFVPIEQNGEKGYTCKFIVNSVDHVNPRGALHTNYTTFEV